MRHFAATLKKSDPRQFECVINRIKSCFRFEQGDRTSTTERHCLVARESIPRMPSPVSTGAGSLAFQQLTRRHPHHRDHGRLGHTTCPTIYKYFSLLPSFAGTFVDRGALTQSKKIFPRIISTDIGIQIIMRHGQCLGSFDGIYPATRFTGKTALN